MISIICLVYQSIEYVQFVYKNISKYTPELKTGEAEFYFIVNDPTDRLVNFLKKNQYPHYININPKRTNEELFAMGYAQPEYIHRVYRGYNFGMKKSKRPILVLVNSDHAFSPDWLKNLKNQLTPKTVVSPKFIQANKVFLNPKNKSKSEHHNFGLTIRTFNEAKFLAKAREISQNSTSIGNAFMPLMLYKEQAESVGYYPEGNIHDGIFEVFKMPGDCAFIHKLEAKGIHHITVNNSIVYHFHAGEKKLKI